MSSGGPQGSARLQFLKPVALTITDILANTTGLPIRLLYDYPDGPQRLRGSSGSGGDHH